MKDKEKIDNLLRMIHKKYPYIKGYYIDNGIYIESKLKVEAVITIFIEGNYNTLQLENLTNKLDSVFNSKYDFDFMDVYNDNGSPYFDTANIIWF